MELQEQFITDNNLSSEQVTAINSFSSKSDTELKQGYEGKANKDAEGILTGAAAAVQKSFGFESPRGEGEKITDYFHRLGDLSVKGVLETGNKFKSDYETKLKDFKGNDALQSEFDLLKESSDIFKQKAASFEEWEKEDYKGKAEGRGKELLTLKRSLAFSGVKPNFPDSVNKFEADAKWKTFTDSVDAKYDFGIDENGDSVLKDKTNEFSTVKLEDLVKENKELTDLLTATKNPGIGSKPSTTSIEGVPFKVSENMTSKEITQKVKDYLVNEKKIGEFSPQFGDAFSELYSKIKQGKTPKT